MNTQAFRTPMRFMRRILYAGMAYISLVGLVTFSLFLLEESIQMATFGTWPASDAQDYRLVREGLRVIESANRTMKIINYSIGWVQPLAFLSYRAYAKSTDYYIASMKAKIFAHDPGALIGERVTATISLAGGKVTQSEEGTLIQPSRKSIFVLFPYNLFPSNPLRTAREVPLPTSSSSPPSSIRVTGLVVRNTSNEIIYRIDLIHPVDS